MDRTRNKLIAVITGICLAVTFVAAGLALCMQPLATDQFAKTACVDSASISPFTADQLAEGAKATREYTVGNHNVHELQIAEARINVELYDTSRTSSPLTTQEAESLRQIVAAYNNGRGVDYTSLKQILDGLDERYALDDTAIGHLDDVYDVINYAIPILIALAVAALIGALWTIKLGDHKTKGKMFLFPGAVLLVVFAALGAWAAVDFYGFFNAFHSLFFSNGSWLFSYDSLLICMLPQDFWMDMGILWLATTAILSVISVAFGIKLLRKS